MKRYFIGILIASSFSSIAQLPKFELITPSNPSEINVDFFQGGRYQTILEDIDSDGDLDFIQFGRIDGQNNNTMVYLNDGVGNFTAHPTHTLQEFMQQLGEYAFVDLNNDHIADMVYSGLGISGSRVALGDGTGDFENKPDVNNLPTAIYGQIFPIDINQDGNMDLLISGGSSGNTSLYANDGAANFTEVDTTGFSSVGSTSRVAASQPYNGGKVDIAFAGGSNSYIYQYDGIGNFTLTSSTTIESENSFSELKFGDINGDGIDDLFVMGRNAPGSQRVPNIYINDGSGNYTLDTSSIFYTTYSGSTTGKDVFFADVTGNGVHDVAVSQLTDDILIYHNDGTGNFSKVATYTSDYYWKEFALGDVDNDGDLDFIDTREPFRNTSAQDDNAVTSLFLNDVTGNFENFNYNQLDPLGNVSLTILDLDNDGLNDVVINGLNEVESSKTLIYTNDGDFEFTATNYPGNPVSYSSSLVFDYNRDGLEDVLLVGGKSNLSTNQGDGTFSSVSSNPFTGVTHGDIVELDVDGDLDQDIIISGSDGSEGKTYLYLNFGKSDFRETDTSLEGYSDVSMDVSDVDGDGHEDVIFAGTISTGPSTNLYFGDGKGGFAEQATSIQDMEGGDVKLADIDGDSDVDLIITGGKYADPTFYQEVYKNNGAGQFTLFQSLDGLANSSLTLLDVDNDGDTDFISTGLSQTTNSSTTTLYLNDGTGQFSDSGMELRDVQDATIVFEDLDQDYDKDLLLFGEEGEDRAYHSRLYRNTASYPVINETVSVCGNYDFFGNELTASGNYMETITTDEGESRAINLDLTIFPSSNSSYDITASAYYSFNEEIIRASGTHKAYYTNTYGCDSIVTLNLTIEDFHDYEDYEHVNYELILPEESPQIQSDFEVSRYGSSVMYDMDGDGDEDYLLIGQTPRLEDEVIGYLNQGNGRFMRVNHDHIKIDAVQSKPIMLHADLNGDGIEDLIMSGEKFLGSSATDLGTRVYFGNSNGGLTLQEDIALPSSLYGFIEIADLSGDGHLDILMGSYGDAVYLYTNDGLGGFTPAIVNMTIDVFSWDAAVSSPYNGETIDILVADYIGGIVHKLYRFDGTDYTLISTTDIVAIGYSLTDFVDINADGAPDIVVSSFSASPRIYLNDGSGGYTLDSSQDFEGYKSSEHQLEFVDLNNDEAVEVLIGQSYAGNDSLYVFWNNGSGNFSSFDAYEINDTRYTLTTGDVNGDEYIDFVINGQDKEDIWKNGVFINDQSNGFNQPFYDLGANVSAGATEFSDFDGDGDPDLIVSGENLELGEVTELFLNDGDGSFKAIQSHTIDSLKQTNVAFADVNQDGTNDMVISGVNRAGEVVTKLYLNNGTDFTHSSAVTLTAVRNGAVEFFDVNGDEFPDLITIGEDASSTPQAFLYLGDGAGGLTPITSGVAGVREAEVAIGNVNGDTHIDILISGKGAAGNQFTDLYFGGGDGKFTLDNSNVLIAASDAQLADMDGDGDQDIYLAGSGVQHTYLNDGTGNFSIKHYLDEVWKSEAQFDDIDLDGDVDFIVSGNWKSQNIGVRTYLYVNDGEGNFTRSGNNIFRDVHAGSMDIIDIDGDLDNDLVFSGTVTGTTSVTRVYRNITCSLEPLVLESISSCEYHEFYGQTLTSTGIYTHTFVTSEGCARSVELNFTMLANEIDLEIEACETYEWNSITYTESGSYSALFTNDAGCDSTVVMNLTILEPTSGSTNVSACGNYTWNDATYLASGSYSALFENEAGCDSTATLNLTILEATASYDTIQVCDSYLWNEAVYSTSGDYSLNFTSTEDCDSIAHLNLSILSSDSSEFEMTVFDSYTWNDVTYETSGSYEQVFESVAGCDSTVTLKLDIDPLPEADFIIGTSEAAHFSSFASAVSYLKSDHVYTADVSFSVEPGTYNESIALTELGNEGHSVSFIGEEVSNVIIQPIGSGTVGVLMEGVTHVIFTDLTIDMGSVSSSLVQFDQNENQSMSILHASDILIDNIHLINTAFSDFRDDTKVPIATAIYLDDVTNVTIGNSDFGNTGTHLTINDFEDVTLLDNHFDVAHRMIKIGQSGDELAQGLYIDNNQFEGKASVLSLGFKLNGSSGSLISDLTFRNNVIHVESDSFSDEVFFEGNNLKEVLFEGNQVSFGYVGFDLSLVEEISFISNTITGTQNAIKIADYSTLKLHNNDVQIGNQYALWLVSGEDLDLVHNSLYATEFSGHATARIRLLDGESRIQNNVFGCAEANANHMGLNLIDIDADDLVLDHNLYDANAQQPLVIGNLRLSGNRVFNSSDFSEWQATQQLFDQHSKSFQTNFESSLALESPKNYRFGQLIETVTIDLNGTVRVEVLGIDVGAYQHCGYYHNSTIETCEENYVFHGNTMDTSGYYEVALSASNGCDSIASIDLIFLKPNLTEESIEACGGYIFGTQVLNESGFYLETFSSIAGCDSVVSLNFNKLRDPIAEIVQNDNSLALAHVETGVTYQWVNCETGEEYTGATESIFNPETTGLYAVKVTNGVCTAMSDCLSYEASTTILSTGRPVDMSISTYPNPTSEVVHVELEHPQVVVVSLITLDGKVLSRSEYEPLQEISLRLPKPGVYMIRVTEEETGQSSLFRISRIE